MTDGVSGVYEAMRDAGELIQLGGRVVPVGPFLAEAVRRFGLPQAIAADRWRAGELEDGVTEARLSLPEPTWRGQGWRDGAEDVRAFRAAVLENRVAAPVSLAMRAAFAEAQTVSDASANEKLAKAGRGHEAAAWPRRSCGGDCAGRCRRNATGSEQAATALPLPGARREPSPCQAESPPMGAL